MREDCYLEVIFDEGEELCASASITGRRQVCSESHWGPFHPWEREHALKVMANLASRDHVLSVQFVKRTGADK